ncbi:uncharacterized protein LOC129267154 [Lytechinus pictus]|uniref:uncharacterized protein LOC129267154 n=1 Tax=Lytechinus pictus TaxID=7653 RepID=UPI0030B9B807
MESPGFDPGSGTSVREQGTLTSDVPDDTVYTDGQKTVRMGDSVVLTCRFRGSPLAVYWKKGDDPRTAPNLVSWIIDDDDTRESCEDQSLCEIMEMNENRSLVIKEVSIAEEGRYICRVSDYKGDFIHNFTDIRVFSPPSEPYPRIEKCPGEPVNNASQSCSLPASDSVTITCTASNYFPDIDLSFLHEVITTNATYSHIVEETNVDGTKNKSVSIVARPSENPYVCVASRIPGSQDRRTVSVTVYTIESTVAMTTTQTNQTTPPHQRHGAAKVGTGDSESAPLRPMQDIKGKVSFYELWHLIHHVETKYSDKLREAFIYLKICPAGDELTADNAYNFLCQWKDTNTYDDEATMLKNALIGHGFERSWKGLCDLVVPEYLHQEISPDEIRKCVYRLAERHVRRLATSVKIKDENQITTTIDENKEVLLIVEQMINDWLIGQECGNYEKRCKLDDAIIEIGRHDLTDSFGTTSYRAQSGDDHETEHSYAKYFDCSSLFDDDIESLLRYLPTGAIPMFLEKLGISQGDDDVGERLRCWRDRRIGKTKGCSLQKITTILIETLQETNNNYVLSLNDDDLENIVASMTSPKQMEVLASKLKIKPEGPPLQTLKDWMDGSKKDNRRHILWKALTSSELSGCIVQQLPSEHVYKPEILRLAWSMFFIDVLPLANLLEMNFNSKNSKLKGTLTLLRKLFEKSKTLDSVCRRDFSVAIRNLGYLDVARSAYIGYDASLSELCNMVSGLSKDEILKLMDNLELEKDILSVCKGTTGEYDIVRPMEIWKRQHSLEPFHYRLKLAFGLRAAGKTEIARKIIAGSYGMVAVNPDVLKSICNGMGHGHLERLVDHLGLNVKGDNTVDTLALVIQWATGWFSKIDNSSFFESLKDKFLNEVKSRKEYIDNLYKAGFVGIAEELMLLEVSRLCPIKQVVDEPCEIENQETSEQNESENNPPIEECYEATVFSPSTDGQDQPCNNENGDTQL